MTNERKEELELLCSRFRNQLIDLLHSIQTGHPGGSLSCTELLTALYFEIMNVDPEHPDMEGRDRLVLSKGHAAPMLYLALAEKGFFPREELKNLRRIDSMLQGHPAPPCRGIQVWGRLRPPGLCRQHEGPVPLS